LGLSAVGNKGKLIERLEMIFQKSQKKKTPEEEIKAKIRQFSFTVKSPIHKAYGTHFNLVDREDYRWYQTDEKHHHRHWETRMLLAVLRFGIINSFAICENRNDLFYREWRKTLTCEIAKNGWKTM
jgi:hypothetical protein